MYLLFHTLPIRQAAQMQLFVANGKAIPTYGKRLLKLDLRLRREFNWPFIIAAISQPMIGQSTVEFLGHLVSAKRNHSTPRQRLQPFPMGDQAIELYCDVASNRIRPFVSEVDRKRNFPVCILFNILGLRLLSSRRKNDTYGLE
ncbi:hypothetical protein CEXT_700851 [Caerostris extrusa]|uniref:Uncharacterized protein n=1 Tax=Caerostris extrusa TaxID=172846 RepID=A0AAV4WYG2_CAEEX|nr:hypothetical protein CEXT_700851 [Caerostris extrusa]